MNLRNVPGPTGRHRRVKTCSGSSAAAAGRACLVLVRNYQLAHVVVAGLRARLAEAGGDVPVLVPPMYGDEFAASGAERRLRTWWEAQRTGLELSAATLLVVDVEELTGLGRVSYVAVQPGETTDRSYARGGAVIEVPSGTVRELVDAVVPGMVGDRERGEPSKAARSVFSLPRPEWQMKPLWDRQLVRTAVLSGALGITAWLLPAAMQPGLAQAAPVQQQQDAPAASTVPSPEGEAAVPAPPAPAGEAPAPAPPGATPDGSVANPSANEPAPARDWNSNEFGARTVDGAVAGSSLGLIGGPVGSRLGAGAGAVWNASAYVDRTLDAEDKRGIREWDKEGPMLPSQDELDPAFQPTKGEVSAGVAKQPGSDSESLPYLGQAGTPSGDFAKNVGNGAGLGSLVPGNAGRVTTPLGGLVGLGVYGKTHPDQAKAVGETVKTLGESAEQSDPGYAMGQLIADQRASQPTPAAPGPSTGEQVLNALSESAAQSDPGYAVGQVLADRAGIGADAGGGSRGCGSGAGSFDGGAGAQRSG